MPNILVNGKPSDTVDVLDRAVQYGDGLFETLACNGAVPELWQAHIARLRVGCERLGIPMPDPASLREDVATVAAGRERCVVKLIVSRGSGGRGYRPMAGSPTRIAAAFPWPDYPADYRTLGITVRLCGTPAGLNPALAGIKHLNRLENVLARAEWDDAAIAEGLMCDPFGRIVEGTMTNIFLVRGGALITPDISGSGVAGVMRGAVMDVARRVGVPVEERPVLPDELAAADEAFLTNSVIRLWPIASVGGNRLPDARPVSERLPRLLDDYIKEVDGVEKPAL